MELVDRRAESVKELDFRSNCLNFRAFLQDAWDNRVNGLSRYYAIS